MLFKKAYLLLPFALLASPSAFAQSTASLSVTGTITPSSCTPSFAGGDVDMGTFVIGDLSTSQVTDLPGRPVRQLTVQCNRPTRFGLSLHDNRASSRMPGWDNKWYGIGVTPNGERFGGVTFYFQFSNMRLDGATGTATLSMDGGNTWNASGSSFVDFAPGLIVAGTTGAVSAGPQAISTLTLPLSTHVAVTTPDNFTTKDEITIDGSVTMEVIYL